jgi:HPt (histidine-containing phosphotransfer) domain-containing protein
MEPTPTLDPAVIGRLSARWGVPFAHRMLAAFVGQCDARSAAARDGLANGDPPAVAAAAHALRSSAGNVGATALVAAAQRLESTAMSAPDVELAPLVAGLVDAAADARMAATEWMAQHPPEP